MGWTVRFRHEEGEDVHGQGPHEGRHSGENGATIGLRRNQCDPDWAIFTSSWRYIVSQK